MMLPITEALAKHMDALPISMEVLAERAGGSLSVWYRIRRNRKGYLKDEVVAMLARGLGVTEDELLRIALGGPAVARGDPCAGKPPEISDLCRAWPSLDESTKSMVLAVARAAILKHSPAAHQDTAKTA